MPRLFNKNTIHFEHLYWHLKGKKKYHVHVQVWSYVPMITKQTREQFSHFLTSALHKTNQLFTHLLISLKQKLRNEFCACLCTNYDSPLLSCSKCGCATCAMPCSLFKSFPLWKIVKVVYIFLSCKKNAFHLKVACKKRRCFKYVDAFSHIYIHIYFFFFQLFGHTKRKMACGTYHTRIMKC